ncbi:MAG: hypothetical protein ACREMO_11435 [Gemmatimonadales bacterium]
MPLTRFPDHEDKRVSDRLSVAVFWIDRDSPSARELSLDFVIDLIEHGALGVVCGGGHAETVRALFERAVEEGEFVASKDEAITTLALPEARLDEVLWTASEEVMPPDAFADRPWDIVVWHRSGDPKQPEIRRALARLSHIVEEIYDRGGEDDQ